MAAEESRYMELAGALRPLLSPKEQPVDHAASPWTFQGFLINCIPTAQNLLARLWRHDQNEGKRKNEKVKRWYEIDASTKLLALQ